MKPDRPCRSSRHAGRLAAAGAALLLGASIAACTPEISTHGFVPDPENLAQVVPGVTHRDEVWVLLGTPTSRSTEDASRWYYVTRVTENLAFYDPDFVDASVILVDFNDAGIVEHIEHRPLPETEEFALVGRETPTQGKDLGLLEQLFGNLGKFDRGASSSGPGPGGGR
jgi:outer membrane protein assembly factor BamE (lipoprotein component of BamABCDE complex)